MKKKSAQNLLEYMLIAVLVAMAGLAFVTKFDYTKLKNYVFSKPTAGETGQIRIEAMTR